MPISTFRRLAKSGGAALAVAAALAAAPPIAAQTWTGAVSGQWGDANNWNPLGLPGAGPGTALVFGATTNTDMSVGTGFGIAFVLNRMTFSAGGPAYTAVGNPLDFRANGPAVGPQIVMDTDSAVTIGDNLTLTNSLTVGGTGAGALTLNGAIGGNGSLTYAGAGVLTLGGSNSYANGTIVNRGVVAIPTIANGGLASPIGASSNATGNLQLGSANGRGTLLLAGAGAAYSTDRGAIVNGVYANGYGGAVDVSNGGTNLTWAGRITGAGSLIKTGDGTLTLTNLSNGYTGGTYIEAGTLTVGAASPGSVIPENSHMTVSPGATFQLGYTSSTNGPLGTLTLNGGTLRAPAGLAQFALNKLVMTGGLVDLSNSGFQVAFQYSDAAITTNASSNTAVWVGTGNSLITTGSPLTVTVAAGSTATGIDLDAGIRLYRVVAGVSSYFIKAGAGTMRLTNLANDADFVVRQGAVRVDDVTTNGTGPLGSGNLTLDGGRLAFAGGSETLSKPFTVTTAGGGVDVLAPGTTLTVTGPITGNGLLTKSGPGVLVLDNLANQYAGGITVSRGGLEVGDDAQLGAANPTVSPAGTLRYTASTTTTRTFNLAAGTLEAAAGVTLTLDGAAVNGGFMRGAGTFAVTGGAALSGTTTFGSTTVRVVGPASFVNFANGGPLTVDAGLPTPMTMNGFTNKLGGQVTVGAGSRVNAADFESAGTVTLAPGPSFAGRTELTNVGASPLSFGGGSRTFVGTPASAGAMSAGIDLNGKDAVVAGGLFVNNGFVVDNSTGSAGRVVADFGALVKGAGFYQSPVVTQNGGRFQAGNSPGVAMFGSFTFGPSGVDSYLFAINDATGTAGPAPDANSQVSGWGLVRAVALQVGSTTTGGDFAWTADPAHKLAVALQTLLNPIAVGMDVPGPMAHFDPSRPYAWPAVTWAGEYTGPADAIALNAATTFDTSGVLNPVGGTFGWSLDLPGQTLSLSYTPVPEPSALALGAVAAGGLARSRRRKLT